MSTNPPSEPPSDNPAPSPAPSPPPPPQPPDDGQNGGQNDDQNEGQLPDGQPRSFPWFWLGTFVGSVFSAVGLGLLAWAWIFVQEDLSPLVARLLTDYLERPVELGDVEQVTFGSIQIGPSTIGASEEDSTTLDADTVVVEFDLVETLLTSKLGLDLTVVGAEGYLAQDPERGWLNVDIPEREEEEPRRVEVSIDDVRLRDSQLTLLPLGGPDAPAEPILLEQVRGELSTEKVVVFDEEEGRATRFEITGEPVKGGEITLKGEVMPVAASVEPPEPDVSADGADETIDSAQDETDDGVNDLDAAAEDRRLENTDLSAPDEKRIAFATNLVIQADEAPLDDIISFTLSSIKSATDEVTITSGQVSGLMEMAFRPNQPIDYSGTISAKNADIETALLPLPIENAAGETQFQRNKWTIDRLSADYGAIENIVAEGLLDFDNGYDLTAVKNGVSVTDFVNTIGVTPPVPTEGVFDAIAQVSGPIRRPEVSGSVVAASAVQVDKLTFSDVASNFLLQGRQLFLSDIAATATTGGSLQGFGQIQLGQGSPFSFQLAGRNLPASDIAALYDINPDFAIGLVSADATVVGARGSVTTVVDWDAPNALYPGSGTIDINGRNLAFRDTVFAIGGGTVSGSGSLIGGFFDSDVTFQNVQLSAFSEDLRGDVNGRFQFSGNTADTRIGAIAAQGNVTFSEGLASFNPRFANFNSPLSAQVAWNGDKIQIIQATSNRLTASGTLTPEFDDGFTGLERFDLNVSAQDYALAELPFDLPDALNLAGRTNVTGTLTGSPDAPQFTGNLQLANLVVNSLAFNPQLAGTVGYTPGSGLALNVSGGRDRIALNVGPFGNTNSTVPPLDFDIAWQDATASGRTQGDILTATAQDFPLAALNFPTNGVANIGQLRGTLSSNSFTANLASRTLAGDIDIEDLGVGYITADRLTGQVSYDNNLVRLTDGALTLEQEIDNTLETSLYTLSGELRLGGPAPVYSANIQTRQGNVQSILTALSIYRLEDFRRGLTPPDWLQDPLSPDDLNRLLASVGVGNPIPETFATPVSLGPQLDRLAELAELRADAQQAAAAEPLPPLRELDGPFAGTFQLNGQGGDFQLDFDLASRRQWTWGDSYSADTVTAQGSLTPNVLTLEPLRFLSYVNAPTAPSVDPVTGQIVSTQPAPPPEDAEGNIIPLLEEEAFVDLAGQLVFGRDTELTSDLQATVSNVDIAPIRRIFDLPVDIAGRANGTATLSGPLANPQLRGAAELTSATINDTPIELARTGFLYRNAILKIDSLLTANTTENPLTLTGQIPIAFDFMEVRPETEEIDVDISVQNEGLALLNIFSRQVAWESGTGDVNLTIGGTLSDIELTGSASVSDGVISARVLPEPLTDVNGNISFIEDQIIVEALQGRYNDGQLTAAGIFPLRKSLIKGVQLAAATQAPNNIELVELDPNAADGASTDSLPGEAQPESATSTADVPGELMPGELVPGELVPTEPVNPLFPRLLDPNQALTVNLENIDLVLEDLYAGGVDGQIVVGGNAFNEGPQIGGQVLLSQGQVFLPDGSSDDDTAEAVDPETGLPIDESVATIPVASTAADDDRGLRPIFRSLNLTLGESVRIVRGGLLNFVADGTLQLSGPASDLEPQGIINIRSGRVNLFSQSFRLRGGDNTAKFTPEMGLSNPFLDVSLRASVPEVNRAGPIASTPFAQAEVADNSGIGFENAGSIRTIRVRARVQGPANAIFENLELSSSPPRSQTELVALIGGGFVTALESTVGSLSGGGDDFGGLVNLVSGALLTSIQDFVGDALSLSEFRLFPVTAASRTRSAGNTGNGLDIGAEVGFDVTEDASLSITKILTDGSNPEFGVNYRLTDSLTVRANTNLDDINQVFLEYEIRF